MSHRPEQVASVIRREVQRVLAEGLSDPRLAPIITVTKVEVGRDLRNATVYVSALPAEKRGVTLHGLRAATRHVRHRIADAVALARTPELHFKLDAGAQNQAEVMRALAELETERERTTEAQTERTHTTEDTETKH